MKSKSALSNNNNEEKEFFEVASDNESFEF